MCWTTNRPCQTRRSERPSRASSPDGREANGQVLLAQRRTEYVDNLQRALDRIVSQLASMPEVERVVLFGSYASGRRDLFTDLDLDLLVYTPLEFEQQRDRGFVRQALQTGRILYERGCAAGG
jgi:predicted nucleotidyltransferase